MKRIYIISSVILLTLLHSTCEKKNWDNPYDPECPKDIWAPSDLRIVKQETNSIELEWNAPTLYNFDGFQIDRKVGENEWQSKYAFINDLDITRWTDNDIISYINKQLIYRIYSIAGTNKSALSETTITTYNIPQLTTPIIEIVAAEVAEIKIEISDNGGINVTEVGAVYGKNPVRENNNNFINNNFTSNQFSIYIIDLEPKTLYYVWLFSKNEVGTNYSSRVQISTDKLIGEFIYDDNIVSGWKWFGKNKWMTDNFASIPYVSELIQPYGWGGIWVYGYDGTNVYEAIQTENYQKYGCLYSKDIIYCPDGWHIPSSQEFRDLIDFIGNKAGEKMKSSTDWDGSNESGFNALPSGFRSYNIYGVVGYDCVGSCTIFWTSSDYYGNYVHTYKLLSGSEEAIKSTHLNLSGCSVRCVKDN